MTKRSSRPVSPQALRQVALAALTVLLVILGTSWLRHSSPAASAPTDDSQLAAPLPDLEVVTCERTLPGEDDVELDLTQPVGLITSQAAVSCPRLFDGRRVTYVGEAVGDILLRRGGAWVQVNDDGYALGPGPLPAHREYQGTNSGLAVWLPDDLVTVVQTPGRSGVRGDLVLVEGILHRVDPADGGGLTIRATSARQLRAAQPIDPPVDRAQAAAALVAALAASALTLRERQVRDKR